MIEIKLKRVIFFHRYGDTMLHLFRGNIGSGLLAMGDAFKNGGIVFAPIMTAILGILCVHSQHLLVGSITFNAYDSRWWNDYNNLGVT